MKTGIKTITGKGLFALGFFGILATGTQAAYFDTAPAPRCDVQLTRTLQTGSEGIEVSVLQNFLNRAGLLSAVPNGHYGPATTAAVRAFQSYNHIPVTGMVGPMTRNAINERMCEVDLSVDSFISNASSYYGATAGVTYVDPHDPFVKVISPVVTTPTVYSTSQNTVIAPTYNPVISGNVITPVNTSIPTNPSTSGGIVSTNIIYSPSVGYTYGVTPASGTLTITTPQANAMYNEGDVVQLAWATNNLNSSNNYTILLENASTNQSKIATVVTGNAASFTLTKELLDAVCAGTCNNSFQGSFRIVITTPIRDIAGTVSTFRAAVSPITIKRPITNFGTVSITSSKTPVNNGELFKLYINIPTGTSWNSSVYGQYTFKIRATCPSGVTTSIAGVQCGQEFSLPYAPSYLQSEIPVMVGNSTWFQQNVVFTLTVANLAGQLVGTASTTVRVNGSPFSW